MYCLVGQRHAVTQAVGAQGAGGDAGHLGEQLRRLQERLVARDAAAKKYKDGCRSLKERCEHLEQVRRRFV